MLPLDDEGGDLYDKMQDGILLCKLINFAMPDTIDPRAIHKVNKLNNFKKHENVTLGLNSAKAIGCRVINIASHDIIDGKRHLILGVTWQGIAVSTDTT